MEERSVLARRWAEYELFRRAVHSTRKARTGSMEAVPAAEQDGIDQREDGQVGADAEREQDGEGESWRLAQLAENIIPAP